MVEEKLNSKELFVSLDNTEDELLQAILSSGEEQFNAIPFKDSWTAAQVSDHIKKSNSSITQALSIPGKAAERNPDERANELKKMFLDFSTKMKSPDFILPSGDQYEKENLMDDLKKSIEQLKQESSKTDLTEAIEHPAFGEITKLELMYFVLYHTQRHLHQIKNILRVTGNN